jgi:hypothetical protein
MGMEKNITDEVQRRLLIRLGHTSGMDEKRWPRKVLEWVTQEKPKRGQPRRDWRDDTQEASERADEDCCRREDRGLGAEKRRQL